MDSSSFCSRSFELFCCIKFFIGLVLIHKAKNKSILFNKKNIKECFCKNFVLFWDFCPYMPTSMHAHSA